ncbi:MAG: mechanosensitive ion channel family protein [Prochlorotrichaceae cyanobacterium]|jgi:MscS family membrane protein
MDELPISSDHSILLIVELALRLGLFLLGAIVSPLVGRWTSQLLFHLFQGFSRHYKIFEPFAPPEQALPSRSLRLQPFQDPFILTIALGFIALSLRLLDPYADLQAFLSFYIYFTLFICSLWLVSKGIRQGVRQGLARLLQYWKRSPSKELLLVLEVLLYLPILGAIALIVLPRTGIFNVEKATQGVIFDLSIRLGIFLLGIVLAPGIGLLIPRLVKFCLRLLLPRVPQDSPDFYQDVIEPFQKPLILTGTLGSIALSLTALSTYNDLYTFLGFFVYLALSLSMVWLASNVMKRLVRQALINLLKRQFGEVTEGILVFETLIYVTIIAFAIIIFALGLRLNIFALGASLGIGGIAVAFAAQQALGRLIGTIELYLDRPYVAGEYIRVTFNPFGEDVYGRIESVGLRSTKIRTVAKNTLVIVPNSMMAGLNIENISRGKKIMTLVCLDFNKVFQEREKALVQQVIEDASRGFWGLDQASTRIQFVDLEHQPGTRARIIFFITGSSQNALGLRKRLIELANDAIAKRLLMYNLRFTMPEPIVYIDSPITL